MHTTSILILVGIVGLALGALLSLLVTRYGRHKNVDSGQQLAPDLGAEHKLEELQAQINEHFDQTAKLFHSLSQSYEEVHEHMVNSALRLSNQDIGRDMLKAGSGKLRDEDENLQVQPPRDWAPKAPGAKGTLSEDFGLEDENLNSDAANEIHTANR
ncbi:MAG: DUF1043 family protein [Gammaproteobacteria bacterium]|nr:DUF1043 family protein [Gammaproteobacteria bacterium]